MRRDESGLSSSPDAELKTYVGIFENFAYGLRYRDISAGLQKFLAPSLDSELNVDYDFAIKHDPIQSDD